MTRCYLSSISLGLVLVLTTSLRAAETSATSPDRTAIAIEALSRLKGTDIEANPSLKAAVARILESTRGTPNFVKIVRQLELKGQNAGLLEIAAQQPASEHGVEAMRLILKSGDMAQLNELLKGTNSAVSGAVEALGNTRDKQAVPLLLPLVSDTTSDVGVRKQVVKSLALTQEGAAGLLKLASDEKLPDDLKFVASMELNQVRWTGLKAKAAKLLPLPPAKNTESLPPLAQLLKWQGDKDNGARVFAREEVGCMNCHRVNGKGTDLGPALSEIGTKLGKDALYEAILDPSAGIVLGFEAWQLELKNGDEAFGLIVSETEDEVVIKDTKAIPTRIKKGNIVKRQQLKTSIMPTGLQQTLSTQDFVDLVDYLSSLKKATQ